MADFPSRAGPCGSAEADRILAIGAADDFLRILEIAPKKTCFLHSCYVQ